MVDENVVTQGSPTDPAVPATEEPTAPASDAVTPPESPSDPNPTGATNWDDDRNPYRYAAVQLQQQMEQREGAWMQQQAAARVQQLEAQGFTPEQAQQSVQNDYAKWQLEKSQEKLNQQARPIVAHELARQITEKYKVDIKPAELLTTSTGTTINSVDAMLARADAIISERRRANFSARKKDGADNLDNGGAGVKTVDTKAYRKMRPAQIIAMGLRENK